MAVLRFGLLETNSNILLMIGQFIAARLSPDTERVVYPIPFPPNVSQGTRQLIIADETKSLFDAKSFHGLLPDRTSKNWVYENQYFKGRLFYDYKGQLWQII